MVIISKRPLSEFIEKNPKSGIPIQRWYMCAKQADCANISDLRSFFPGVDYVGNDLYVFNVGGNKFRIIARIIFKARTMFVKFVGTHKEYDKIDLVCL